MGTFSSKLQVLRLKTQCVNSFLCSMMQITHRNKRIKIQDSHDDSYTDDDYRLLNLILLKLRPLQIKETPDRKSVV